MGKGRGDERMEGEMIKIWAVEMRKRVVREEEGVCLSLEWVGRRGERRMVVVEEVAVEEEGRSEDDHERSPLVILQAISFPP